MVPLILSVRNFPIPGDFTTYMVTSGSGCRTGIRPITSAAVKNKGFLERTLESLRGFTACLNNVREKGGIYGTGPWNVEEIKGSKAMDEAFDIGKKV